MGEQMYLAQYLEHELNWEDGVSRDLVAVFVLLSPAGLPSVLSCVK